ncbi:MAG: DNA polymerase III subunit chi [Tatlockia sp.]|jgi:DNA polymerase-3 subunit chi
MSLIRVDFYLLKQGFTEARFLLACRLLEKAYLRGHRVFVICSTQQEAENLDELLWTFKDMSFIPHNLQGEGLEPPPAIQIGCGERPRGFNDILLNLSPQIPVFYTAFQRIIEIVSEEVEEKELSRTRFRSYRASGCELHTHQIDSALV